MASYRITYTKPSETGIAGRITGSVYMSGNDADWDNGNPTLQAAGYTVTVTNLDTQESKVHQPTK